MFIPLNNLKRETDSIRTKLDDVINSVIDNSDFILGDELKKFEQDFARYCEAKYCLGVDSGTSALELACRSIGLDQDDEVITVSNSYISTSTSALFVGAKPVFVDVDYNSKNINVDEIGSKINSKTKAIIVVHMHGYPCDMDAILKIAKENNLFVIEDASHAHGAIYRNSKIGSFGDITCFSFYPSKNLGCMGDGGAITTNNKDLYERIKLMRTYGESEKFHHTELGYNKRLDNLQAGILNVKLTHLDQWNKARQNAAKIYNDLLDSILNIPEIQSDRTSVFYVYSINSTNRDQLQEFLTTKNIQTSIHYPIPIHKQKLFVDLGYSDKLPVTEQLANETLSLPMFPLITEDEIHYISRQIIEFYGTI